MKLGDKMPDDLKSKYGKNKCNKQKRQKSRNERKGRDDTVYYPFNLKIGSMKKEKMDLSFSLLFTKLKPLMVIYREKGQKVKQYPPYKKKKNAVLFDMAETYKNTVRESRFVKNYLEKLHDFYRSNGFVGVKAKLVNKAIIGGGRESGFENSITLHHIYGFPYIPASSVKGVLRYVALVERFGYQGNILRKIGENLSRLDVIHTSDGNLEDLARIFGTQKYRARIVFSDAIPVANDIPELSIDILNPHYSEYYRELYYSENGNILWSDKYEENSLTPVFFPVIKKGSFVFYFKTEDKELERKTIELFKRAFEEGFGAKTRYNYGAMNFVETINA